MNILLSILISGIGAFAIYIKDTWLDKNIFNLDPKDILNNIFFWGMFGIFILVSFYRILKDYFILKEISKMEKELKDINSDNICQEYSNINNNIFSEKAYKVLSENWRAFKNSLFIKNDSEIYQTSDAEIYFNIDNLLREKMNFKLLNYFPQLLVGLGMLGTFLGLSIGLADLNLSSDDNNQLTTLILGTKTAFYTSLYGMYFSICMSIILNAHLGRYEERILRLKDKINCIFKKYVRDQRIEEIKDEIILLRKSNQELCENVGTELVKGVNEYNESNKEHLKNITTLVSTNISGLADAVSKGFEERLEKIFSKEFIKPFNLLKDSLIQSTNENNKNIENYSNMVKEITSNIVSIKDAFSKVSTESMDSFNSVLDRLENKYKEVIELFQNNQEVYEKYNTLLNNSKEIIISSNTYLDKIESVGNIFENFSSKEKSLVEFWNENRNIMLTLTNQIQENQELWENRFQNQEIKLNEYYEKHVSSLFSEYDDQLSKVIVTFKDMLDLFVNKTIGINGAISDSNKIIEINNEESKERYTKEIKDIFNEFSETSTKLKGIISSSTKYIDIWNKNTNMITELTDKVQSNQELWDSRFKDQEVQLNNYYNNHVTTLFAEYDNQLTNTISVFKNMMELFINKTSNINDAINKSNGIIQLNNEQNKANYTEEIKNIYNEFSKITTELKNTIASSSSYTELLEDKFKNQEINLNKAVENSDKIIEINKNSSKEIIEEFNDLSKNLKEIINDINQKFKKLNKNELTRKVD